MKRTLLVATLLLASSATDTLATGHRSSSGSTHRTEATKRKAPATTPRDAHGRIQRSAAARHAFARQTGYPHGRPGYVIDHVIPLACGGLDTPSNLQWQSVAESKAKDKWERKGCQ